VEANVGQNDISNPAAPMRDSGIEWIGEIPEGWRVTQLKRAARFAYGDSLSDEHRNEGPVPVFGSNGQVGMHDRANTMAPVVVIGRKGSFGKVQYSKFPIFTIDTTFYIDSSQTKQHLRWLFYATSCLGLDSLSGDVGVPGLSRERAYRQILPLPPIAQQRNIADFLDRETAKIDTLIAKRQRIIGLLDEKRSALITQAVTKGLDPTSPMRDSGIEWIGEIPEGWDVVRMDWVADNSEQTIPPTQFHSEYVFHYSIPIVEETGDGQLERSDEIESSKTLLAGDEVLISKLNPRKARVIGSNCHAVPTVCSGEFVVLNPRTVDRDFLVYLLLSETSRQYFDSSVRSVTRSHQRVQPDEITKYWFPLPPLAEQHDIADFIDRETSRIDQLKSLNRRQIELLKEKRQALITAAVTGKIPEAMEVA